MNIALIIALGAVAICLFAVFISRRVANSNIKGRNADGPAIIGNDAVSSDCTVSDGGGCGGVGGGD